MAEYKRFVRAEKVYYSDNEEYLNSGQSWALKVAQGLIPFHSWVSKYGDNGDIDAGYEDVWEYGGVYAYDADGTAPIVSAADTQEINVQGLDINGDFVSQDITLTGTTRVALTTPLWRVFRLQNNAAVGGDINGMVYIYTTIGNVPDPADVRAVMSEENQTLMAIYTIPRGMVGFLQRWEVGGSRSVSSGAAQCALYTRNLGKVFKNKKRVDVTFTGNSFFKDDRPFPDPIPALTDIKVTVESVSNVNTGVFATFDILLVDQKIFSDSFLVKIGQPA